MVNGDANVLDAQHTRAFAEDIMPAPDNRGVLAISALIDIENHSFFRFESEKPQKTPVFRANSIDVIQNGALDSSMFGVGHHTPDIERTNPKEVLK